MKQPMGGTVEEYFVILESPSGHGTVHPGKKEKGPNETNMSFRTETFYSYAVAVAIGISEWTILVPVWKELTCSIPTRI